MNKITVYGFEGSTYVRSVLMTCIEKGVEYSLEGFEFGSPQHMALHPFMKMPAARVDGHMLYETLAIVSLINEMTGTSLQAKNSVQKATMLKWISSAIDDLYPALVESLLSGDAPSAESINNISKILLLLEKEIQSKKTFLNGNQITLADIFLYPMLHFSASRVPDFAAMTVDLAGLRAWLSAMDERESVIKTLQ